MNTTNKPDDNPYAGSAAPATPTKSASQVDEQLLRQTDRPRSIWLALGMMLLVFLTSAALAIPVLSRDDTVTAGSRTIIMLIFQGMILAGFWTRHRLAWQWGRVLAIISGLLLAIGFCTGLKNGVVPGTEWVHWTIGLQSAALITIFFALGRPSARVYFRLVCPQCHRFTNRAGDFFFKRARCKECHNVW